MGYFFEFVVFIISAAVLILFMARWYNFVLSAHSQPYRKLGSTKTIMSLLPPLALVMFLYTLINLAAFDVVGSIIYIILYVVLGFAWVYLGMILISYFWDLSWIDDPIGNNNRAALLAICGGFICHTLIYCGANIGDGPGWWCVVFAALLGLVALLILGLIANAATKIFERITVHRDTCCGLRFSLYLLAMGIALGRGVSGDWTSFGKTIIEVANGWAALPITAFMMIVEGMYRLLSKSKSENFSGEQAKTSGFSVLTSLFWGGVYVAGAVCSILLLPPFIR